MEYLFSVLFAMHCALALVLFFMVNWIGRHAIDFGYVSTSLFEEPNESVALNFFIRALSPAVFIIIFSSLAVSFNRPELRFNIFYVAIYYYIFRAGIIIILNRHRLVSWPRYLLHAASGIFFAMLAYYYLILPNKSLLPDLEAAGNELWLALLAFLYAVANKITLSDGPGARRRNSFVDKHYFAARARFGSQIDSKVSDEMLRLIVYSVLVYEDYCRPPSVRMLERLAVWKKYRTTGIMQVSSAVALSDVESVERGIDILSYSWENHSGEKSPWSRLHLTLADYNKDDDYINRVNEVMRIIVKRSDTGFEKVYNDFFRSV
jgi:hypothetical protein